MRIFLLLIIFLITAIIAEAQSVQQLIEKGNTAYDANAFNTARQFYEQAIIKDQAHQFPEGIFNLGNALFQQQQYDPAAQQFISVTKLKVPVMIKAQAFYNLGNCYLQQKNYQASINAYQQTLKMNPRDEDARYNLSFATAIIARQSGSSSQKNATEKKEQEQKPLTNLTQEQMKNMLNELNDLESKTLDKNQKRRPVKPSQPNDW